MSNNQLTLRNHVNSADGSIRRDRDVIVFDWDGTVVDSIHAIATAIREAARDLGLEVPSEEQARHVIGLGLHDALRHAVPDLPPARLDEFTGRYRYHFLRAKPADRSLRGGGGVARCAASRATAVGVVYGAHTAKAVRDAQPNAIAASVAEVAVLLGVPSW